MMAQGVATDMRPGQALREKGDYFDGFFPKTSQNNLRTITQSFSSQEMKYYILVNIL